MRGPLLLLIASAEATAVALALGIPDLTAAQRFLFGSDAADDSVRAVIGLLLWALVAVTLFAGIVAFVSTLLRSRRRPLLLALSALAGGMLILSLGIAHQRTDPLPLGGGSLTEARQLAR